MSKISIYLKSGYLSIALESTLKREHVIENVRSIYWIVPKQYILLDIQKFESDNIEFEKSVLIYIIVYRKKYVLTGYC
jgi:hypothetical protein